jgi:predicted unusual protein kinase regulating ubiquinone biosynthesis (AarF/ABC1/UbiB family)
MRFAGGRFFGLDLDRGEYAAQSRPALGNFKGSLMKVARVVATIPDALPDECITELAQL